jgi:hypothetical protein
MVAFLSSLTLLFTTITVSIASHISSAIYSRSANCGSTANCGSRANHNSSSNANDWKSRATKAGTKAIKAQLKKESREEGENRSLDDVKWFWPDIDSDGRTDAVAEFYTAGSGSGTGAIDMMVIYNRNDKPVIDFVGYPDLYTVLEKAGLTYTGASRGGIAIASVRANRFTMESFDYHVDADGEQDDAMCCPSIHQLVELEYKGKGRFGFLRVAKAAWRETDGDDAE